MKWYERPLRVAALQCESEGDSNRVADVWMHMGFNVEQLLHISAEAFIGYYREDQEEKIRNYIAKAKSIGLRIIFYLGMLGTEKVRADDEWAFVDSRGNRIGEWSLCINSPYRDWYMRQVRKLAVHDIDGVFIDGPFFPVGTCYCKYCRDAFRAGYGADLPTTADPADKTWHDFIDFRYESVASFMGDVRTALHEVKPDAILYSNGNPHGTGAPTGRSNRLSVKHQDLLGAEGGFIFYDKPDEVNWWKPGTMARLLESQSEGRPTVIFIAGDHKMWNRYLHTPGETRLLIADTVANGASPWYGIHSEVEDLQSPGGRAAGEMMRFLRDNEEYYTSTESVARIALLWSTRTSDWYDGSTNRTDFNLDTSAGGRRVTHYACFDGFCEILLRQHVPFDIIDEQTLFEEKLSKYEVLILPNCAVMTDEEMNAVRDFVRAGGNVVSSFETSLYNNDSSRKAEFGLSDLFGVELGERLYDFGAASYMSRITEHQAFDGVSQLLIPAPTWGLQVSLSTAESIADFREPLNAQYRPVPPFVSPAISVNSFGKGRSIYLAGSFGSFFKDYGIRDHSRVIDNLLKWISEPLVSTRGLPETVEIVLRRQSMPARLMLHLVNFTGAMRRPIAEVVKVHDGQVILNKALLNALSLNGKVKCTALMSGATLEVQDDGRTVCINLPPLSEYEVLALSSV